MQEQVKVLNQRKLSNVWHLSLVAQIFIGLLVGIMAGVIAQVSPWQAQIGIVGTLLGSMFVGALKAVAPLLVFVLVIAAISQHRQGNPTNIRPILMLYLVGTFAAAISAVAASFLFPSELLLSGAVMRNLLLKLVANPVQALAEANYLGILAWGLVLGAAFRHTGENTRTLIADVAAVVSQVVRWVIRFAPIGIFGLVLTTIVVDGFAGLERYLHILYVLVGTMLFVALVVNPILVFTQIRQNPYPLVLTCLRESGVSAFFTRSSAANIPVNMNLCRKLGLHEDTYSISIPLGATINMGGAAITITILTLAAVHTLQIPVDFWTAVLLSMVAAVGACGASGVAGGSLLLIPMACSLFAIDNDIAMQVVGVGFLIGVIQDSAETALNSSTDVMFTAAVDQSHKR